MLTLLFDSSSLVLMLLKFNTDQAVRILSGGAVLDLTVYEVGNAIWKRCKIFKAVREEEAVRFMISFRKIIASMRVFSASGVEIDEVLKMALGEGISFYDATYIQVARREKFDLVTDDRRLAEVATKYVRSISSSSLEYF